MDDTFYVFDLDGTLTDTDINHHNAYKKAGLDMGWSEFETRINTNELYVTEEMRSRKNEFMKDEIIKFIPGAEEFLATVKNHVVVTNSTRAVVDSFIKQLPLLGKLNILTREDYENAKPSPDGYNLGIQRYYKNEKYIVGFENTIIGYESIKHVAQHVYIVTREDSTCHEKLKDKDIRFIQDYKCFHVPWDTLSQKK